MIRVSYEEAAARMAEGLRPYLPPEEAMRLARIFADNSADGVHSHGMNRFPRCVKDMRTGVCDPKVLRAERISGLGGLEVWDAHFGVGPLIAEQMADRVSDLGSPAAPCATTATGSGPAATPSGSPAGGCSPCASPILPRT